ncbi:hypothetical protein N9Q58_03170 [Polaribacter sp.]|nr:hypothetical protein [Polaribacter sp.]
MSKTKKSLYNLIASLIQVLVMQVITLVVSREVLAVYGSEINGVNAVFTNTLVWLMLIEGGFTFASSVALFKAFAKKDVLQANKILSATKKVLYKIGAYVGLGGVVLAFVAPFFIKTSLSYELMLSIFLLMAFGAFFGLIFTRKYLLMLSVKQEEYFKTSIAIVVSILINLLVYLIAVREVNYIWIRVVFVIGVLLTGIFTYILVKKRYPYISYNEEPDMDAIKGTKDMVFNKLASLVNSSVPLIYIAAVVGASYASVYAVYMIVFGFITKLNMMVANAVQNGFGQLIAEKNPDEVHKKFTVFEFLLIFTAFLLVSIAMPVTMPFIKFYTKNVFDVNYVNWNYLYLFVAITLIKIIHIPSGIVMLMSGAFKKSKKFQIRALVVLVLGIVIGGFFWKVEGILLGIFVAGMVLAIQEIHYTRTEYFKTGFQSIYKILGFLVVTIGFLITIEFLFVPNELSFGQIVYFTILFSIINFAIMGTLSYLFFNDIFKEVLAVINRMIKNK